MFIKSPLIFLTLVALSSVLASPAVIPSLEKRGAILNEQFATESEANGRFTLERESDVTTKLPVNKHPEIADNLWGEASATSGSQTSQADSVSGGTVSWHTNYTWVGGNFNVKSYANLDLRVGLGKNLVSISSIPVHWDWKYTSASSNLVADVSYDLWLSNTAASSGASSSSTFEIMVWLSARGGAGPAGSQIGTAYVNDVTWKLFKGKVSTWTVFSFVAPVEITSFSSDLKPFFTFLETNQDIPSSQFLVQAQGGTEPFIGSATLTTNAYSISII